MQQRIIHGAAIETATPQEIAEIIAGSFATAKSEHFRREKGVINLDANGNGTGKITAPRLFDYVCERVTLTAAGGALFEFYENSTQESDMLEVVGLGSAGRYSDAFSNNLFVPAGSQLFIVCTGGGANAQATFNLQIRMIRTG